MLRVNNFIRFSCLTGVSLLLIACDQAKPTAYQIPKEERSVNFPPAVTAPAPPSANSAATAPPVAPPPVATKQTPADTNMNILPGMKEAADAAGTFIYTTPKNWLEMPASGIRKATFYIDDGHGSANLTVTVFPGNVGGLLANVNRWRSQIGFAAITENELAAFTESYPISNHPGIIVTLEGEINSVLGALLPFHGNTWFFKLQGETHTVLASKETYKAFLDSVKLPDEHH